MAVYDSMKVNVSINNTLVTGYADGTMVTSERNEDRVVPYSGVKGEYAYSLNIEQHLLFQHDELPQQV